MSRWILLFVCFVPQYSFAAQFLKKFNAFVQEQAPLDDNVRLEASNYHFVFVAGFLNETFPYYFLDNISALQSLGVLAEDITTIYPSSLNTPSSNVSLLKDTLERLPRSKKIVIIGHSKGALESLIFALENKFFVRDHVEAMFLIQGPFLGSPIADYLVGRGRAVDERIPFFSRIFLHSAYYVLGTALSSEALHSMTSHSIFNFWDARKTEIEASPQDITEPIFFIRTHQDYRKMSFFIDESGRYLDTYYGSNDGLVMLEDQSLPSVGQTIATLDDTDHADLMLPSPLSSKDKNYRIAFTHTLLWWLSSSSKKY